MIEIVGWIDVDPASRDELVARTVQLQQSTRDEEPGCLAYVFAADPVLPGRIHVYERWADEEALDAHFAHPNFTASRELLRSYPRVGSETKKHRVGAVAPVNTPEGVPSATHWPDEPA